VPESRFAFLLAPGAGAPTSHPRMQTFARLLGMLGPVHPFDYSYMLEARKRPDPMPKLIAAHRSALAGLVEAHEGPVVLAGKSMGGRVGCHLALQQPVAGLVCLGYPLCGGGDCTKLRDQVLVDLRTPILFVQGARDKLCPLPVLAEVRGRMTAPSHLHVVEGGDHSLLVSKTELKARGVTQDQVDQQILAAIGGFVRDLPQA
jgi:uncharacterized protein